MKHPEDQGDCHVKRRQSSLMKLARRTTEQVSSSNDQPLLRILSEYTIARLPLQWGVRNFCTDRFNVFLF
jgi:hypothetical protein